MSACEASEKLMSSKNRGFTDKYYFLHVLEKASISTCPHKSINFNMSF